MLLNKGFTSNNIKEFVLVVHQVFRVGFCGYGYKFGLSVSMGNQPQLTFASGNLYVGNIYIAWVYVVQVMGRQSGVPREMVVVHAMDYGIFFCAKIAEVPAAIINLNAVSTR